MLTKTEVFKDIQDILRKDYSGHIDKAEINCPEKYRITDDMSDEEFKSTIQSYLLDFKDGHLWFTSKNKMPLSIGFQVRRFKDALYVIKADEEKRVEAGDRIILIDGLTIPQMAIRYAKELEENDHERQQWQHVLKKAKKILVKRNETQFEMVLSSHEYASYNPEYYFDKIGSNTAYLKITDFAEEKPILDILKDNKDILQKIENLIVDVRVNHGGNDEFYFPLLDYIFDYKVKFKNLFVSDENMYTNYTERNCDLWINELEDYLTQDLDEETSKSIHEEIKSFQTNYGKGFLEVPEESEYLIEGGSTPRYVYILTDYYCGSSGDTFVANVKKSDKVTVVGRATMGIMNYFNVVTVDYGDYEFDYSISKMTGEATFGGEGGVEPDIYIPWTPDHLRSDVDLEYVYKLIDEK